MRKAEKGGKVKTRLIKIIRKLTNNLGLKLISVAIAVVLWFLVVISQNPKDSRNLYNIPVTLTNVELLEKENKVYEVLDKSDIVRVTVEAPRDVLSSLQSSDIMAVADVSKLSAVNTIAINFTVINEGLEVSSITGYPDVVRLSVEDKESKWVNIRLDCVGEVAEGYTIVDRTLDFNRLEVSGPKSAVDSIDHAKVEYDVTDATTTTTGDVEIHFCDAEGNVLDLPNITKNADHVRMTVRVLPTAEIPIEIAYTGSPAEGYLTTGVMECQPPTVMIAGTAAALAGINKISIPAELLDITGATENVVNSINIKTYLPGSVQWADSSYNGKVLATVYIEPEVERTLKIAEENLNLLNLPEGFELEYGEGQSGVELKISGLEAAVSAVQESEVRGTVDIGKWMEEQEMEELAAGRYNIPVSFELPGNVNIENEAYIRVIIVELEEEEENNG